MNYQVDKPPIFYFGLGLIVSTSPSRKNCQAATVKV